MFKKWQKEDIARLMREINGDIETCQKIAKEQREYRKGALLERIKLDMEETANAIQAHVNVVKKLEARARELLIRYYRVKGVIVL